MSTRTGISYTLTRTLDAPVDSVWQAWTTPERYERWWSASRATRRRSGTAPSRAPPCSSTAWPPSWRTARTAERPRVVRLARRCDAGVDRFRGRAPEGDRWDATSRRSPSPARTAAATASRCRSASTRSRRCCASRASRRSGRRWGWRSS
ncbi:SRPBCC family protein [Streptomyces pilosus]|uniref:SRPBCC family protein n=1 Tax=Streptomyces pilosus TaxID=28893 RepID=UPI0035715F07